MTNEQRMVPIDVLRRMVGEVSETPSVERLAQDIKTVRDIIDRPEVGAVEPIAYMPLMRTGLAIRMDLLNETQAKKNHFQTLQRLAERGGLSPSEAAAIAESRKWASQKLDESFKVLVSLAPPAPVPVEITDEMAYAFHRVIDDSPLGASDVKDIKEGLRAAFANAVAPVPAVPDWRHSAGASRAEWHNKAWALFHAKTFNDSMLHKVNIHTMRAVFDATYDALFAANSPTASKGDEE